jgi:hypothetical protein
MRNINRLAIRSLLSIAGATAALPGCAAQTELQDPGAAAAVGLALDTSTPDHASGSYMRNGVKILFDTRACPVNYPG